ncbi:oligosaccharide flippase family protein [Candidatus Saccharibacteria bacterium]|nr:oligosaccharide flippase family protein [Candidatus Saccharibacteria bacterium]
MNILKKKSSVSVNVDRTPSSIGIKKGIVYVFVANVINMVINLFTAFLLPKFLSVDTYASIKLFTLYVTYLGILHLGYADGMYLRFGGKSIYAVDGKEAKVEFDTFKIFQIVMCLLLAAVSVIINNQILLLCSLIVLPVGVSNYVRSLYGAVGEFKRYSRYTNINTIMIFIINVILLFIIKTDCYLAYIIAYIVAYFIYWIFIEHELRKILGKPKRSLKFDKRYLEEDVRSGIFLMTGNFCNVIFTSIDRLFIKGLIGMAEFAYYSFAVSVENLLNIFVTPISTTMYNYFCREKRYKKVMKIKHYTLLLAGAVVSLIFPAKFVIEHWIPKYNESISVLFFLIAAQYMAMIVKIVHVNLYKSRKQQKKYFKIMFCIILASVVLNAIMFLLFRNMVAIAIATFITNIIWFIVGEIDLREYALKLKDYLFFTLNVAAFVVFGLNFDAALGFCCYLAFLILNALLFEFSTCKMLFLEVYKYMKRLNRKKKLQ